MSEPLEIVVTILAAGQIRAAEDWWRIHRPKAPNAIREDLDRGSSLIAVQPEVGARAQNVVPEKAEASIDARLVKGEDPRKKYEQIVGFIRKQGFYVIDHEPTMDERREHARIAKIVDEGGYRASRTAMDLPVSKALVQVVQDATGGDAVIAPTLGGSVPMYIFEDLGLPWIGVPIANYDNHQHSSDENLRLGQFWRGIEEYGAILADLNW